MSLLKVIVASFLLVSCATSKKQYPESWWTSVPKHQKKSWEISPDSVEPPQVILSKRNELGLLSNFAPTPFIIDGKLFASLEGFWQATKYPENKMDPRFKLAKWPFTRRQVEAMVGFEAKRAGDFASKVMKKHKITWVTYQGKKMTYKELGRGEFYKVIRRATEAKLNQNSKVKTLLASTKGLKLLPDHRQGPNPPAAWRYYEIYEEIRDQK